MIAPDRVRLNKRLASCRQAKMGFLLETDIPATAYHVRSALERRHLVASISKVGQGN